MPLSNDALLAGAGAIASSVNAAAGGGTLLSFPSLLAAGLSPLAANATSTVGLLPGQLGSAVGLRKQLHEQRSDLAMVAGTSLVGGVLGALLLLGLGGAVFAKVVPALLVAASALLLSQPLVARLFARGPDQPAPRHSPAVIVGTNFAVAIYAGYFGAGAGILFLGVMGLVMTRDLQRVNALKVLSVLIANTVGAAVFIVAELWKHPGAVVPRAALPLAVGAVLGGYFGVKVVLKLPPQALRGFASLVGLGIAAYLIFRK